MAANKGTRVAVLLGGRSPEHDVSVITGLQALQAIDQTRFDPFPVYVNPRGQWFVGEALGRAPQLSPGRAHAGRIDRGHAVARRTRQGASSCRSGRGCSVVDCSRGGRRSSSMSHCRRFTASTARTGRSRGCSKPPTCPMPGCAPWPPPCSWTRSRQSVCCADRAFRYCPMRSLRAPPAGRPRNR